MGSAAAFTRPAPLRGPVERRAAQPRPNRAHAAADSTDYPGRGTLDVLVTTCRSGAASSTHLRPGPRSVAVGKLHDSAESSQTKTLRVPLSHRAQTILARRGKLPIRLSLVFTPEGGQSSRQAAHTPSASWSAHHLVGAVVTSGFLAKGSRSG
jgi:hypothetical protein